MKILLFGTEANPLILFSFVALTCLTLHQQGEINKIRMEMVKVEVVETGIQKSDAPIVFDRALREIGTPESTTEATKVPAMIYVDNLGGDGVKDDTRPIRSALRQAWKGVNIMNSDDVGAIVVLPPGKFLVTKQLKIRPGVTLMGQGIGISPTAQDPDKGGSTILYCGDDYAVRMLGDNAALEKVAITDHRDGTCSTTQALGGVAIIAEGESIESVSVRDILIYKFISGTSLHIEAKVNSVFTDTPVIVGSYFENIRIHDAKIGIHLKSDTSSYVRSNMFNGGIISGDVTDVAVKAEGPGYCNDNIFNGMSIEPKVTSVAHVHINGQLTNVRMNDIRLDGSDMPADRPMVLIDGDSQGNVMNGELGQTFVQANLNRNPGVTFLSRKFAALEPAPHNLLWNAAFRHLSGLNMPGWTEPLSTQNIGIAYDTDANRQYPDHNVLIFTGATSANSFNFGPLDLAASTMQNFYTFGIWAKSSSQGSIFCEMKDQNDRLISSAVHTGSGNWEFISMSSEYVSGSSPLPYVKIVGDAHLTAPSFTYGSRLASPGAEFLSSSGGKMAGVLSSTYEFIITSDVLSNTVMTLPRTGNYFPMSALPEVVTPGCPDQYEEVTALNNDFGKIFERGTVITIITAAPCGGCTPCLDFKNGDHLFLTGGVDFRPKAIWSSITLMCINSSTGDWIEISRNEGTT